MIQCRDGFGFALKTSFEIGVRGEVSGEDLDGDIAAETGIACAVDFAHAARA